MSTVLATHATVVVPGVPENWSNLRVHHMVLHRMKDEWKQRGWYCAQSARNAAGWPLPVKTDPPAPRWMEVEIHKRRPHYDDDGAVSCLKPLVDSMKGVLLVDDSPAWCALITPPSEMQRAVAKTAEERVVLTLHLVDPR